MFGMGAGEILILLIVGIVVVGPQKLPGMMRTAGQWVSRLRRMSTDLRAQSGIDRIIRDEGLEKELRELRSLSRAGVLDSLMQASAAARAPLAPLARPQRQAVGAPGLGAAGPATEGPSAGGGASKPAALAAGSAPEPAASASGATQPSTLPAETSITTPRDADPAQAAPAPGSGPAAPRVVVRPAAGTVARHEVRDPYRSFREREYPTAGCDHYDAMPDDLDEPEEPEEPEEPGAAPLDAAPAERHTAEPVAPGRTEPSVSPSAESARTEA